MIPQIDTHKYWHGELAKFFANVAPRLSTIFRAEGARELWLQGEAFNHFNVHEKLEFWTNYQRLDAGTKADLACFHSEEGYKTAMVAEVKLYARDFLNKNLMGRSNISQYVKAEGPVILNAETKCNPLESSLLKDFNRLKKFTAAPVKLLVLILADAIFAPDGELGQALDKVEFGTQGTMLFQYQGDEERDREGYRIKSGFKVKVWDI